MNIIDKIVQSESNIAIQTASQNTTSFFKNQIIEILDSSKDFNSIHNANDLSVETINSLSNAIKNRLNYKFAKIMFDAIKDIVPKDYLSLHIGHVRPSLQPKFIWPDEDANYKRKTFIDQNGFMHEKKGKYNYCFPTRPHQDLSNNGFRSSHVLIFYFQLTDVIEDTSDLEICDFTGSKGLYKYNNKWGYYNQLEEKEDKRLKWYKPEKLRPGNVLIMDSFTLHKSSLKAKKPRLAINAKIHPDRLNYLFDNEQNKKIKSLSNNTLNNQLTYLRDVLKERSNYDSQSKFELAVVNFLLGHKSEAFSKIDEICLFNCSQNEIKMIITGAFLKKTLNTITNNDIELVMNNMKWVDNSCVHTIINTFK